MTFSIVFGLLCLSSQGNHDLDDLSPTASIQSSVRLPGHDAHRIRQGLRFAQGSASPAEWL